MSSFLEKYKRQPKIYIDLPSQGTFYSPEVLEDQKEIIINNTLAVDRIRLKTELEFLKNTSLFFLKKKEIIIVTNKHGFISSIQLKKK